MVKGNKREHIITYKEVLQRTSGGYDIYMAYEGKVPKSMKSPWRKDNNPSFGFYQKDGIWCWRDIAREEAGTAIEYVMNKFGLNFGDAMQKVLYDFGIGGSKVNINPNPIKITWEKKEVELPVHISFTSQPFQRQHHEFWNCAGVQEVDCNRMECWAVKDMSLKRKRFFIRPDEAAFAYYAPEEDKVKIYLPDRGKGERFWNSVSYFYLWNSRNIQQKVENLVVQKSVKDMIVTSMLTPNVIATQAEGVTIFNEETVRAISDMADNVFISYGSDEDGKTKSIKITKDFGWKWVNPPNKFLPDANDFYLLAKLHGMKELEKLLKYKKII